MITKPLFRCDNPLLFTEQQYFHLFILKIFGYDTINVTKISGFHYGRVETVWKKEKELVPSIFFIPYNVFQRLFS